MRNTGAGGESEGGWKEDREEGGDGRRRKGKGTKRRGKGKGRGGKDETHSFQQEPAREKVRGRVGKRRKSRQNRQLHPQKETPTREGSYIHCQPV